MAQTTRRGRRPGTTARPTPAPAPTPALAASNGEAEFDFANVQPRAMDALPKIVHKAKDNPLMSAVVDYVDKEPQYIPVPNGAMARKASNLLRRAAGEKDYAIKIRYTDADDKSITPDQAFDAKGNVFVCYEVKSDKTHREGYKRSYTDADVREFHGLSSDAKLTKEQRNAFRESRGLRAR